MDLHKLGIQRVRIPLPFRLNHVNCYLAKGAKGWAIIDAGLGYDVTRETWERVFSENGLKATDIQHIYLTHHHPDHYGFLGQLQSWTGAEVWASRQSMLLAQSSWSEDQLQKLKFNYLRCGIPHDVAEKMDEEGRRFIERVKPHAAIDHFIEEGDEFRFGALVYKAVHTPGHALGHMALWNEKTKVMIGGDQVLSKITPNISYRFSGSPNPLKDYLDSLRYLKDLGVEFVIPGHGHSFDGAKERIDSIIHHHDERFARVLQLLTSSVDGLGREKKTAYDLCLNLFDTELDAYTMRPAIGETLSHLMYLIHAGRVWMEERKGILFFSAV